MYIRTALEETVSITEAENLICTGRFNLNSLPSLIRGLLTSTSALCCFSQNLTVVKRNAWLPLQDHPNRNTKYQPRWDSALKYKIKSKRTGGGPQYRIPPTKFECRNGARRFIRHFHAGWKAVTFIYLQLLIISRLKLKRRHICAFNINPLSFKTYRQSCIVGRRLIGMYSEL